MPPTINPEPVQLLADNKRNPTYYELRAGYPAPTQEWYRGISGEEKTPGELSYSQEKLVRGLNLTCGEFYKLRRFSVSKLRHDDLYKLDFNTDKNAKWDLNNISRQLEEHPLWNKEVTGVASNDWVYWNLFMTTHFVSATAKWMCKNEITIEANKIPRDYRWKWGKLRKSKDFNQWFQYQHLSFVFLLPTGESWKVSAHHFVPSIVDGVKSPDDILLDEFKFSKFIEVLKDVEELCFDPNKVAVIWGKADDDSQMHIHDDATLQTAISTLRVKRSDKIEFVMIEKGDTKWTGNKHVDDEDRRPGKRKKGQDETATKKRKKGGVRVVDE